MSANPGEPDPRGHSRRPRVAVILFPGSNCDHDALWAAEKTMGAEAYLVRHDEADLKGPDLVILPGGFSYGDYLRCGAMARFSRAMSTVERFAAGGGPVLGICNGFQILCEAGLLPGALIRNAGLRFVCRDVHVRVETLRTPFTRHLDRGEVLRLPVAHGEGGWVASPEAHREVLSRDQVVFRYVTRGGVRLADANPNGSLDDVAGLCNEAGNVVGLMPHPERCCEDILGNTDGARLFTSVARSLATRAASEGGEGPPSTKAVAA